MSSSIWTKVTGPSAGLVQKHLVEARKQQLYARDKGVEQRVARVLREHSALQHLKLTGDKWVPVYQKISRMLQASDLTINFNAADWFATENTFETYTQGYQRSGLADDGRSQFKGDTQMNPAKTRADIDDRITFGGIGGGASAGPRRGLAPGRQGIDRIKTQMEFRAEGAQRSTPNAADANNPTTLVSSTNSRFNADTKQVFAALNYGRRAHGSTVYYGSSHLVLKPGFKVNALYYGGDTFYMQDASQQVAYQVLGAIVMHAKPALLDAIIASCYSGAQLNNTRAPEFLLEAHLFTEVRFKGNIESLAVDAPIGSVYHANAKKFAAKHGARLIVMDPAKA